MLFPSYNTGYATSNGYDIHIDLHTFQFFVIDNGTNIYISSNTELYWELGTLPADDPFWNQATYACTLV